MTVSEFKEKYPHLAHLEGNALWDAMSKAVYLEDGGKMVAVTTQEELEKVLREKFTDDRVFEERFKNFGLLIPSGVSVNHKNIPHVADPAFFNSAPIVSGPDVKGMSFDELAEWAKKQPAKDRKNKK